MKSIPKALIASLLVGLALASPAMAERLVPYGSFVSGGKFYIDLDSFKSIGRNELSYYVYGFADTGNTVSLNTVDCTSGGYRSGVKTWQIEGDRYVNEQQRYVPMVFARDHSYFMYTILHDACGQVSTANYW